MIPHVTRPKHLESHPVHVTIRTLATAPGLRQQLIYAIIERELRGATRRGVRVLAFSVQRTHVHLIIEATDRVVLWRGMQRFASRVARIVNRLAVRRGQFWRDRYHRQELRSPSQLRNAYVYVLMNVRKHVAYDAELLTHYLVTLDPYSSACWFEGWDRRAGPSPELLARARASPIHSAIPSSSPVVAGRSWIARTGWERRGRLRLDEMPKVS